MSLAGSCHGAQEHSWWAHFQERLLEKVKHNREENEGSHHCDCQTTADAGSSRNKSLARRSISALNAHTPRSRRARSVGRLLAATHCVTLFTVTRSNQQVVSTSWLQTHSHVAFARLLARSLSADNQAVGERLERPSGVPTAQPGATSENRENVPLSCGFTVDVLCDTCEKAHLSNPHYPASHVRSACLRGRSAKCGGPLPHHVKVVSWRRCPFSWLCCELQQRCLFQWRICITL